MANLEIKRGEIFFIDFNTTQGSEIRKNRPALVIQNDNGNRYGNTIIVAAITSKPKRDYPFQVRVVEPYNSGLYPNSTIMLDQIHTITRERFITPRIGLLSEEIMIEVNKALIYSLELRIYSR